MSEKGVGLVEIMVSLILASLLILISMQHYLTAKRQALHIKTVLEQSLDLQLVISQLNKSIRSAGFTPCMGIQHLHSIDRKTNKKNLSGIEIDTKKQILTVKRMSDFFSIGITQLSPTKLLIKTATNFYVGQRLLIADCLHAEVLRLAKIQTTKAGMVISFSEPLAFNYYEPFYLGEWIEEAFFIATTRQGHLALFYKFHHAEELSKEINSMSLHLNNKAEKTLVSINLDLKNNKSILVETGMRAG